ncbi:sugar ABC transporter substrate-binding protein [Wenjunlia tyrosinilytica]|uniref:Sugar ABC transporter substrate-binding protein n=1 Tax=Wenjunlia tyrosinilytica TaxID=1544741 RepID=A0A917ZWL6_9ACTN|nr:sugar ABC transporter substrate-binding protein [Wenjunlia tyrosinilytica]
MRAGGLGAAAAALAGTPACSVPTGSTGRQMTLWYWTSGLSDKVVGEARRKFTAVDLRPVQIGGYFRSKLLTNMAGRAYVPDITGLKGEDMASYHANADQFMDLRALGADALADRYLPWKWRECITSQGRMIGFPIDVGPTAHYYRPDVFERAGLPTEPDDVAAQMSSWDTYFAAGRRLRKKVPGASMILGMTDVFQYAIGQSTERFVDKDKHFIGDGEHVRHAWDLAVRAKRMGITSHLRPGSPDQTAALAKGRLPSQLNPSWWSADLKLSAPGSKGKWRVARMPGGPANYGGSFLAITKYCRKPEQAFEIITWLLDADNQTRGFTDAGLFPSTPASYTHKAMRAPDPFFGGQVTVDVFGPAAEKIPVAYNSPYDVAVSQPIRDEIVNINDLGKDPDDAWRDAMSKVRRIADHLGVS